jgi:hypothetical protein
VNRATCATGCDALMLVTLAAVAVAVAAGVWWLL